MRSRVVAAVGAAAGMLAAAVVVAQDEPLMFVTSATGDADLGGWPEAGGENGITAADAICQSLESTARQ